eukprot:PhF_6_TR11716/c3_g2_i4/m.19098
MSNFSFTSSMVESTLQSLNNVDAAGVQELIPYTIADITSWITPLANLILDRTIQQHNRQRYLIGITGPSGGGKSVLGQCMSAVFNRVSMELGGDTICIGVDGYHHTNKHLEEDDTKGVKGRPCTFDVVQLYADLRRLSSLGDQDEIALPTYNRVLHEPVNSSYAVVINLCLSKVFCFYSLSLQNSQCYGMCLMWLFFWISHGVWPQSV